MSKLNKKLVSLYKKVKHEKGRESWDYDMMVGYKLTRFANIESKEDFIGFLKYLASEHDFGIHLDYNAGDNAEDFFEYMYDNIKEYIHPEDTFLRYYEDHSNKEDSEEDRVYYAKEHVTNEYLRAVNNIEIKKYYLQNHLKLDSNELKEFLETYGD